MGADIYLESVSNKARAQYEPLFNEAVQKRNRAKTEKSKAAWQKDVDEYYSAMFPDDGYYRDSYNPSAFLWLIDLSWWEDVTPMLDDEGYLPIEKAKTFLAMVEARLPITLERVSAHLDKINAEGKEQGLPSRIENKPEGWLERWQQDAKDLCALLRKSIELNEPLYCSL